MGEDWRGGGRFGRILFSKLRPFPLRRLGTAHHSFIAGDLSVFWPIDSKSKPSHQHVWLIEMPLLAILAICGGLLAVVLPLILRHPWPFGLGSVAMMWVGVLCLLISKLSLFRQGLWASWGTHRMSRPNARFHRTGYGMVGLGIAWLHLVGWLSISS